MLGRRIAVLIAVISLKSLFKKFDHVYFVDQKFYGYFRILLGKLVNLRVTESMASPKYDNLLYTTTLADLNKALPMEWTIRALQVHNSAQYQCLQSIDSNIHDFWRKRSFLAEEISDLELMEFSWDFLQIGKSTSRSFTKVIHPDVHQKFWGGLKDIYELWSNEVKNIKLPCIARNYRYFDVLHGNDIERLLKKVSKIVRNFNKFTRRVS